MEQELGISILEPRALIRDCLAVALEEKGFRVIAQSADSAEFLWQIGKTPPHAAIVGQAPTERPIHAVIRSARALSPSTAVFVLGARLPPRLCEEYKEAGAIACWDVWEIDHRSIAEAVRATLHGPAEGDGSPAEAILPAPFERLSRREKEVLGYLAAGFDNLKIAAHLDICERTVKAHVSALYRKLGQENRTQLALIGLKHGLKPYPKLEPTKLGPSQSFFPGIR